MRFQRRRLGMVLCWTYLVTVSQTFTLQPRRTTQRFVSLAAESDNSVSKKRKASGVYSRPSAAIERGSGFFIPGLEGPRVRLAAGLILLALSVVNHNLSAATATVNPANTAAEGLAAVFSLLVLLQALIEYTKDARGQVVSFGKNSNEQLPLTASLSQQWSMPVEDQMWRRKVEWAATLFLSLTPATHIMLVGPGKILYRLGSTAQPMSNQAEPCLAALETAGKSKGGRVSLPATHPAATGLAPVDHNRSVVLQRIDKDSQLALLISSDQLLQSFTKQDLQWLGQLARYVAP